jgi:hypothetical protein
MSSFTFINMPPQKHHEIGKIRVPYKMSSCCTQFTGLGIGVGSLTELDAQQGNSSASMQPLHPELDGLCQKEHHGRREEGHFAGFGR